MHLHNVLLYIGLQLLLFSFATSLDPVAYLRKYGYLQPQRSGLLRDIGGSSVTRNAVLDFQRFVGLPQTGVLDTATLQKMEQPRCGNMDRKIQTSKRRKKRYRVTDGERWNKNVLSYKIFTYSNTMTRETLDRVIDDAFRYWSDVTNVRFYKSSASHQSAVDIPISFVTGDHGDLNPFDGQGGALAHAFYPRIGDIHFDDAEPWSPINLGSFKKYLLPVAVHEIGHSLGLNHSEVESAVMAPYYKNYPFFGFQLHQDDINGIQSLFGVKNNGGGGGGANTNQPQGGTTANGFLPHLTYGPQHTQRPTNYQATGFYPQLTTYLPWFRPTAGGAVNPPYVPTQGPGNNHNFRPTGAGVTDQNWIGTKWPRNTGNVYVPTTYKPYTYVPTQGPPRAAGGWYTPRPTTIGGSSVNRESFREWLRRLG